MNMNAGGQTIADRINAARFGLAGHMLAKAVCKATTEEQLGPKKKHLDYLLHCTEEPNVSIPQLANLLLDRLQHPNWVVVFKALVSIHHLMLYGNERFIQYLASANSSFSLNAFLDNKSGVQGYDMSTYIRRYSKYLNQKALSYRMVAFDFCKVKRGKDDGVLRKMPTEKLLKTLPVIQDQMDALLEFDCSPNELTNAVISSCFVLLFRDLIRLFACYNDGIINMLEKYFDMNKKMCKDALDIYKKFLVRMDKVATFLKVAENVGIPKGEIPDLTKAPASLLDALEQHLDNLEGNKKSAGTPPGVSGSGSIHAGLLTLSQTEHSLNEVDEKEKQRAILEEQQAMEEIRKKREQQAALQQQQSFTGSDSQPFSSLPKAPSAVTTPTNGLPPPTSQQHHHAQNTAAAKAASKSDLFDLLDLDMSAGGMNNGSSGDPFGGASASMTNTGFNPHAAAFSQPQRSNMPPQALFSQPLTANSNPFGSPTTGFAPAMTGSTQSPNMMNPFAMSPSGSYAVGGFNGMAKPNGVTSPLGQQIGHGGSGFEPDFGAVFGAAPAQQSSPFGGMVPMKPPSSGSTASSNSSSSSSSQPKLIQNNVDTSLANLAANLNLGTMGSYGVRPVMVTQSAYPPNTTPGSVFGGVKPLPSNPMNPVNNSGISGQQGQYQFMNSTTTAPWNPFMGQAGTPVQQSPTRAQPQSAATASNDPFFASLI